ncbi:MAG: ABC transporter permease [Anaerolineae bacterium]|nr:ABC transporter permease [Anaerolineae bacterium]
MVEQTQSPSAPTLFGGVINFGRGYVRRLSSGDLGGLPIFVGLIIMTIIFQAQNGNFLTPRNMVNLILQMAGTTMIAYGMVFVLLLGEIDLSVGYVSAVGGVTVAILLSDANAGWTWPLAIPLALLITAGIGLLQGLIITLFRVPSFIVTLAGLLAWNGVVLRLVGRGGTVIIQDPFVVGIANSYLPPETLWGWVVVVIFVLGYAATQTVQYLTRRTRGLSTRPLAVIAAQIVLLGGLGAVVVAVCNQDRGLPVVGVLLLITGVLLTLLAKNTRFGRFVYAVGGNAEAARRAGLNVNRIRVTVFVLASMLAGLGGIILASRLRSVDTRAGSGNLLLNVVAAAVIGGTSLFGGRGRVSSAIWGALIIASLENGMGLLNVEAGDKYIITGIVLLLAVIIDSLSRRRQQQSGLA